MRHRKSGRQLNRNSSHRKALMKNLATSLFMSEKIITSIPKAKELRKYINNKQKLVVLFVNADLNVISHITEFLELDVIQLHGDEDLDYIKEVRKFKKPIIIERTRKFKITCNIIKNKRR